VTDDEWHVIIMPKAEKDLVRLPAADQRRVKAAIDMLSGGPHHGDILKLQGGKDAWRLRVGDWRIRLLINGATRTIVISRVLPRGRAYRD